MLKRLIKKYFPIFKITLLPTFKEIKLIIIAPIVEPKEPINPNRISNNQS
jgi:hypothetical protein